MITFHINSRLISAFMFSPPLVASFSSPSHLFHFEALLSPSVYTFAVFFQYWLTIGFLLFLYIFGFFAGHSYHMVLSVCNARTKLLPINMQVFGVFFVIFARKQNAASSLMCSHRHHMLSVTKALPQGLPAYTSNNHFFQHTTTKHRSHHPAPRTVTTGQMSLLPLLLLTCEVMQYY